MEDVEPRSSLRLDKKKVTMGAVESGYAGTRQINPRVFSEEEDASWQDSGEHQEPDEQGEACRGQEEATEGGPQRSCRAVVCLPCLGCLSLYQLGDTQTRPQGGWHRTRRGSNMGATQMTIHQRNLVISVWGGI